MCISIVRILNRLIWASGVIQCTYNIRCVQCSIKCMFYQTFVIQQKCVGLNHIYKCMCIQNNIGKHCKKICYFITDIQFRHVSSGNSVLFIIVKTAYRMHFEMSAKRSTIFRMYKIMREQSTCTIQIQFETRVS